MISGEVLWRGGLTETTRQEREGVKENTGRYDRLNFFIGPTRRSPAQTLMFTHPRGPIVLHFRVLRLKILRRIFWYLSLNSLKMLILHLIQCKVFILYVSLT